MSDRSCLRIVTKCQRSLLIASSLVALVSCSHASETSQNMADEKLDERPNMIVVLVDDMRWDETGIAGHPYIQTPNIGRIANEGMQFTNPFAVNPLCSPSRATLLTGQHAHYHGITDNLARNEQSHHVEMAHGIVRQFMG